MGLQRGRYKRRFTVYASGSFQHKLRHHWLWPDFIDNPLSLLWLKIKPFMAGNVILNFIASNGSITFLLRCNNLIPQYHFLSTHCILRNPYHLCKSWELSYRLEVSDENKSQIKRNIWINGKRYPFEWQLNLWSYSFVWVQNNNNIVCIYYFYSNCIILNKGFH